MSGSLPDRPSLEHLAKQAKALLKSVRAGDRAAARRLQAHHPRFRDATTDQILAAELQLSDAQRTLAREAGFSGWTRLREHVEAVSGGEPAEVALPVNAHVQWMERFQARAGAPASARPVSDWIAHEARVLLQLHAAGDVACVGPLRLEVPDLRDADEAAVLNWPLSESDALDTMARAYIFESFQHSTRQEPPIEPAFESAVDAVVRGDLDTLGRQLDDDPNLAGARSPFGHRSTLLHYVAANGVEIRRQRTPRNAAAVARRLLDAGAEVDARNGSYGGGPNATTLCLTVTSCHPAEAGVQGDIVEVLLDAGAAIEGSEDDGMPLANALAFGYEATARLLVARGARVRNLVVAAGLGDEQRVAELIDDNTQVYVDPFAGEISDHRAILSRAFFLAGQRGRVDLVRRLLDAGADVNATAPHDRTLLHWAAYAGNRELVELLLARGADPRAVETYHRGTPADWAREGGHGELADWIASQA